LNDDNFYLKGTRYYTFCICTWVNFLPASLHTRQLVLLKPQLLQECHP